MFLLYILIYLKLNCFSGLFLLGIPSTQENLEYFFYKLDLYMILILEFLGIIVNIKNRNIMI